MMITLSRARFDWYFSIRKLDLQSKDNFVLPLALEFRIRISDFWLLALLGIFNSYFLMDYFNNSDARRFIINNE